jgi:hypothetical protein
LQLSYALYRFVRWYESSAAAVDHKGSDIDSSAVSATVQEAAAATVDTEAVVADAPDTAAETVAHTVKYTDSANVAAAGVAATATEITAEAITAGDTVNTVTSADTSAADTVVLETAADNGAAVVPDIVQPIAAAAAAPTAAASAAAVSAATPRPRRSGRSGGVRIRSSGAVVVEGSYPTTASTLRVSNAALPARTTVAFTGISGTSSTSTAALSAAAAAATAAATAQVTQEQRREQWLAGGVATVTAADFEHLGQAQSAAAVNAADELWRSLEIVKVRVSSLNATATCTYDFVIQLAMSFEHCQCASNRGWH